jgi:hypothetical protein
MLRVFNFITNISLYFDLYKNRSMKCHFLFLKVLIFIRLLHYLFYLNNQSLKFYNIFTIQS